jgi:hypothetical protein
VTPGAVHEVKGQGLDHESACHLRRGKRQTAAPPAHLNWETVGPIALGIAGALVGARVADALEFGFLGLGIIIGAILGAAFFVIG